MLRRACAHDERGARSWSAKWTGGTIVVAGAIAAAVMVWGSDSSEETATADGVEVNVGAEVEPEPGAGSDETEVVVAADPPPEAEEICGDGSKRLADGASCRITASLVKAPPASTRGSSDRPRGLGPITASPPGSFGEYAIHDAADPSVLVDGQTYFVFSTSAKLLRAPVATIAAKDLVAEGGTYRVRTVLPGNLAAAVGFDVSPVVDPATGAETWPDFETFDPRAVQRSEAMPERAPWARRDDIWAPTVVQMGGRYVMFFAAKRPSPPDPANEECIGRAVSSSPGGPYVPDEKPVTCGLNGVHGALDPAVVRDRSTGRAYLLAAFGGTSTPLWSIPLNEDGQAVGKAVPLLSMRHRWQVWFLENPSMIFNGKDYTLAYSSGRWSQSSYSTGVARCSSPVGPCSSDPAGPWLSSAGAVSGPGGLDFFYSVDGQLMAAHHGYQAGREALFGARHTFIRTANADSESLSFG